MESALDVLSRAATMVNAASDTRLTLNKELPTTKWRRDRRIRLSSEYHAHDGAGIKPLGESNQSANSSSHGVYTSSEIPLDMSLGSSKPPPPPYREPLPGSAFAAVSSFPRPSVITQAPRKEIGSNQENHSRYDSSSSMGFSCAPESISMIDPVIDEHFRRSLGADYVHLFEKKSKSQEEVAGKPSPKSSPRQLASPSLTVESTESSSSLFLIVSPGIAGSAPKQTINIEKSVDDHFAKALGGDTWKKLQEADRNAPSPSDSVQTRSDVDNDDEGDDDDNNTANSV